MPWRFGRCSSVILYDFASSFAKDLVPFADSHSRPTTADSTIMESKFYQADEHRAEKVHQLFATIARRYDLLNDIMSAGLHRRWKRRLVELALRNGEVGNGKRVLDLCCGTGDIALAFARAGADVTGVDFTEEMLRVAEARNGTGGTPASGMKDVNSQAR